MRISRDEWAMQMAKLTSTRSTCFRRHVGCVLLNRRGHVLATGYNGVASGRPHCNETFTEKWVHPKAPIEVRVATPYVCSGAKSPSGTNLDGCQAIHAEQNALLQCKDVYEIDACYVTASPCITCTKLLLNTSCTKIIFLEDYPHAEARDLWTSSGREWTKYFF